MGAALDIGDYQRSTGDSTKRNSVNPLCSQRYLQSGEAYQLTKEKERGCSGNSSRTVKKTGVAYRDPGFAEK